MNLVPPPAVKKGEWQQTTGLISFLNSKITSDVRVGCQAGFLPSRVLTGNVLKSSSGGTYRIHRRWRDENKLPACNHSLCYHFDTAGMHNVVHDTARLGSLVHPMFCNPEVKRWWDCMRSASMMLRSSGCRWAKHGFPVFTSVGGFISWLGWSEVVTCHPKVDPRTLEWVTF